jgi:hypothetical protein
MQGVMMVMNVVKKTAKSNDDVVSAAKLIDAKIASLSDWRGETLARVRKLIRDADPAIVETVKWQNPSNPAGVPV